jgi:hypothetical protein
MLLPAPWSGNWDTLSLVPPSPAILAVSRLGENLPRDRQRADDGPAAAPSALRVEEYTDPEMIEEKFDSLVDIVIDGGIGGILPSTVVDCTGDEPVVLRKGLGAWEAVNP